MNDEGRLVRTKYAPTNLMGVKAFVYWNLHKNKWSIKDTKTNRVVAHADALMMIDCTFKVSERGRQRVIATGHKNVHAGVVGMLTTIVPHAGGDIAYYNPHKQDCFTVEGERIDGASIVRFYPEKKVLIDR